MALSNLLGLMVLASFASAVTAAVVSDLASEVAMLFVDSAEGPYLQPGSAGQGASISPLAAAASTAVLLGVGLPPQVDESTATQLGALLAPTPFKRPRAVFTAVIPGIDRGMLAWRASPLPGLQHVVLRGLASPLGAPVRTPSEASLAAASLVHELSRLPGSAGEEVQLAAVGCGADRACDKACVAEELEALAEGSGWTYSAAEGGSLGSLSSADHPEILLDLSQPALEALAGEVACLLRGARAHQHRQEEGLLLTEQPAPRLLFASVSGLQAVQEEGGKASAAAASLVLEAVAQAVRRLQEAHKGRLTASVALLGPAQPAAVEGLGPTLEAARAVRRLQVAGLSDATAEASALLKRAVLWVIGLVLVVTTILGSCALFSMPLTKDTLLYSSAKLD